jgi:hypothetical protein
MAKVFQIVASGEDSLRFADDLVNGDWHADLRLTNTTVCGIQLDGDDGVTPGRSKEGEVTCLTCRSIIEEIQSIKNWR